MEDTKRLKDAIRLRDAYILLLEKIQGNELVDFDRVYNGILKPVGAWDFYRDVEFKYYIEHPFSSHLCIVSFVCTEDMATSFIKIDTTNMEVREYIELILVDYKDLILK